MQSSRDKQKMGILGGGQLALMLAECAAKLDIDCLAYLQHANDPAGKIVTGFDVGSIADQNKIKGFFQRVDVATFESEFIDCSLLRKANSDVLLRPSLSALGVLQNKLSQKKLCAQLNIPTGEFAALTEGDLREPFAALRARWPDGCAVKWARNGYDGKGVFLVKSWSDADPTSLVEFAARARSAGSELYAESLVNFQREVAVVATRSSTGKFVFYPLVTSEQSNGICKYVVRDTSADSGLEPSAHRVLAAIGDHLQYVGTLAVEFFVTGNGALLVNEIAPRVHNTGHYSQDACDVNQFENHVRAVCDLDIKTPQLRYKHFGMVNLIGSARCKAASFVDVVSGDGIFVRWYNKIETRPGRKMGHINVVANSPDDFARRWSIAQAVDHHWQQTDQLIYRTRA